MLGASLLFSDQILYYGKSLFPRQLRLSRGSFCEDQYCHWSWAAKKYVFFPHHLHLTRKNKEIGTTDVLESPDSCLQNYHFPFIDVSITFNTLNVRIQWQKCENIFPTKKIHFTIKVWYQSCSSSCPLILSISILLSGGNCGKCFGAE